MTITMLPKITWTEDSYEGKKDFIKNLLNYNWLANETYYNCSHIERKVC